MGLFDWISEKSKELGQALENGKAYRESLRANGINPWTEDFETVGFINEVAPGSVIRHGRYIYDHYGIYAGNRRVIHFSDGEIKNASITDFANGSNDDLELIFFTEESTRKFSLAESLQRAEMNVGIDGYNLIYRNCEHFAIWCRTGIGISTQAFGSRQSDASLTSPITAFFAKEAGMKSTKVIRIR